MNLIEHLPPTSHYMAAVLNDEEVAEQAAAAEVARGEVERYDGEPLPLPLTAWTPEVQLLTKVVEKVAEQTAILIAVNSKDGKFKAPKPEPRPLTALQKARAQVREQRRRFEHSNLMRLLFPNA